jgi:hypothetical protein
MFESESLIWGQVIKTTYNNKYIYIYRIDTSSRPTATFLVWDSLNALDIAARGIFQWRSGGADQMLPLDNHQQIGW